MHNNQLYACRILEAQSSTIRNRCRNMVTNICFSSNGIDYLIMAIPVVPSVMNFASSSSSLYAGICLLSRVLACEVSFPFVLTGIASRSRAKS